MARELKGLGDALVDGRRGIYSSRDPQRDPRIPERLVRLFHRPPATAPQPCGGGRKLEPLCADPPVYLVRNFLSARELEHLDALITSRRAAFKQSVTDDAGGKKISSAERTSFSLHLPKAADTTLRAIESRAADIVGLPSDHVEPLQVVNYTDGQRFDLHHDLGPMHVEADGGDGGGDGDGGDGGDGAAASSAVPALERISVERTPGPKRLVTLFVYLNTLPDGVGHTEFPLIDVSVRPQCGAALVFCNVNESGAPDARTCHCARPVPPGHTKFGCNIWITDVTQQAHAVSAMAMKAPKATKPQRSGSGLLGALLQRESGLATGGAPPAALVGLRVRKRFGTLGTFKGTVAAHHPTSGYRIHFDDGDVEDIGADELFRLPLADPAALVGRAVSKHFVGHGRFGGVVESHTHTEGFGVLYDDGDREHLDAADLLRILLVPPKPKSGGGAAKRKRE